MDGKDTEKIPLLTGVDKPGADEDIEQMEMGNRNPYDSSRNGLVNPTSSNKTYEETSFGGDASDTTPLLETISSVEERRTNAWRVLEREFPNAEASLIADYNKDGRLTIQKSEAKRPYMLFTKNQTTGKEQINPKLTNEIIKALGTRAEKIVEINYEEIVRRNKKISEL